MERVSTSAPCGSIWVINPASTPDGNQVIVQGSDTRVAFDTPRVGAAHQPDLDRPTWCCWAMCTKTTVALGRLRHAAVRCTIADLAAVTVLGRHGAPNYGFTSAALEAAPDDRARFQLPNPRPDASGYTYGSQWDLGGGVRGANSPPAGPPRAIRRWSSTAGHRLHRRHRPDRLRSLLRRRLVRPAAVPAQPGGGARGWTPACGVTPHHRGVITERAAFEAGAGAVAAKIDERHERLWTTCAKARTPWRSWWHAACCIRSASICLHRQRRKRRSIQMHLELRIEQQLVQAVGDGSTRWRSEGARKPADVRACLEGRASSA